MPDDPKPPEEGERISPHWTFAYVDLTPIPAGAKIAPAKIGTQAAREFAALQLVLNDLVFARDAFIEADKIGVPDANNTVSKALIFSALVAYARPFKTGVRELKLDASVFTGSGHPFNLELHDFLVAVRDKHVAHSVNEFEMSEAVGIMVGPEQEPWRAQGIGFTATIAIGLNRKILRAPIAQTESMIAALNSFSDQKRIQLFGDFQAKYAEDGKWEMAPAFKFPMRGNAAKRRD